MELETWADRRGIHSPLLNWNGAQNYSLRPHYPQKCLLKGRVELAWHGSRRYGHTRNDAPELVQSTSSQNAACLASSPQHQSLSKDEKTSLFSHWLCWFTPQCSGFYALHLHAFRHSGHPVVRRHHVPSLPLHRVSSRRWNLAVRP